MPHNMASKNRKNWKLLRYYHLCIRNRTFTFIYKQNHSYNQYPYSETQIINTYIRVSK